jgi:predicted Zn-dependent protease
LRRNPAYINSRLEIAANHYKVDSAAGIPYAEEVVRSNPHIPFAHYLLGLLYLDVDQYQRAIPQLEIAEKAFPKELRFISRWARLTLEPEGKRKPPKRVPNSLA